ncbi:hypothetical protein [Polymorphospora rubra]|uniref:hypothetical protein n=1 Tax=Polymorphospora rubra TaxID=338584 RepID=UPI003409FA4B
MAADQVEVAADQLRRLPAVPENQLDPLADRVLLRGQALLGGGQHVRVRVRVRVEQHYPCPARLIAW